MPLYAALFVIVKKGELSKCSMHDSFFVHVYANVCLYICLYIHT